MSCNSSKKIRRTKSSALVRAAK
jgi:hypothetical protein